MRVARSHRNATAILYRSYSHFYLPIDMDACAWPIVCIWNAFVVMQIKDGSHFLLGELVIMLLGRRIPLKRVRSHTQYFLRHFIVALSSPISWCPVCKRTKTQQVQIVFYFILYHLYYLNIDEDLSHLPGTPSDSSLDYSVTAPHLQLKLTVFNPTVRNHVSS